MKSLLLAVLQGISGFPGNSQHTPWLGESSVLETLAGLGEAPVGAGVQWCHLKEPGGDHNCLGHFRGTRQRRSECQDYSWVLFVPGKEARERLHGGQGPGAPQSDPRC